MISKKLITAMVGLCLTGAAFTCSEDGKDGLLPDNDLYIPAGLKSINGISEQEFNEAIDQVENVYSPIISSLGKNLVIERRWSDGTVNAYAQQSGNNWKVSMFGGLARHSTITKDAMSLVVCHEIGHHIGGAPKKGPATGNTWWGGAISTWASNEGQSDYFATLKCLRKVWVNDNNSKIIQTMDIPEKLRTDCNKFFKYNKEDASLCIRTSMAGLSVANLFSVLGRSTAPKFDTPDSRVMTSTNHSHPAAQCRLDTYFQGSLCDVDMNEDVSQKDEVQGTCHRSLGHKIGTRPLCWFKPSATFL